MLVLVHISHINWNALLHITITFFFSYVQLHFNVYRSNRIATHARRVRVPNALHIHDMRERVNIFCFINLVNFPKTVADCGQLWRVIAYSRQSFVCGVHFIACTYIVIALPRAREMTMHSVRLVRLWWNGVLPLFQHLPYGRRWKLTYAKRVFWLQTIGWIQCLCYSFAWTWSNCFVFILKQKIGYRFHLILW